MRFGTARIRSVFALPVTAITICVMCKFVLAQDSPTAQHPLVPAIELAKQSQAALEKVNDYECHFTRREFVKNELLTQQTVMRLRHRPFSVYLKFIDPAPGREVLYVQGKNQGNLLAHEASGLVALAGTLSFAVDSPKVMAETRHPITEAGMKNLIEKVLAQWELESKYGETDVKYYPNAKIGMADCEVVEVSHPRPRKQFPYHRTRVFFEKTTKLPVRVENYGFPVAEGQQGPLLEEYTYTNIKVNNSFTDADFDRNNPKYSF